MKASSVRHDLLHVMNSCSAAGLQEIKWAWYWTTLVSLCRSQKWARYPRVFKGSATAQVVIWDAKVWKRVGAWTRVLHGPVIGVCLIRYMHAVRLRNRLTGEELILKTTHYLPNRGGAARFNRVWRAANRRDCQFVEFLADKGVPVISTGDYNENGAVLREVDNEYATDYNGLYGIDFVMVTQKAGRKQISRSLRTVSARQFLRTDHDGRILSVDLS